MRASGRSTPPDICVSGRAAWVIKAWRGVGTAWWYDATRKDGSSGKHFMYAVHKFYVSWPTLWVLLAVLMAVVGGFAIWRRHAVSAMATVSMLALLCVVVFWWRDVRQAEHTSLIVERTDTSQVDSHSLGVSSSAGGIALVYELARFRGMRSAGEPSPVVKFGWERESPEIDIYPAFKDPLFSLFGFSIKLANEPEVPIGFSDRHFWALVVPDWFAVILLSIIPLFWLKRHIRGRRNAQWNLCPKCEYDLRATTDKCPECGTPVQKLPARHAETGIPKPRQSSQSPSPH
jgi:hypothetical protein